MSAPVVVADIVRSGFVEGHHYGSVLALAADGSVDWSVGAVEVLLADYHDYLTVERGLTTDSIEGYVLAVRPFLDGRLRAGDELDLAGLGAAEVVAFVVARCPGQSRGAAKMTVTALRSLLRFLHLRGLIGGPLAEAVPSAASWRLSGLPRALEPEQLERMLHDSSNTATNWFLEKLGGPSATAKLLARHYGDVVQQLELVEYIPSGGRTYRNKASAMDHARFLRALWKDGLPYAAELRRVMNLPGADRLYRDVPDIPVGTEVYNKTGTTAMCCGDMGILVARTRRRFKIPPPAMTGAPEVEWALRVQANTVEQAVVFLPMLWMAALYFQGWPAPAIGLVWCLGRIVYAVGYMSAPGRRHFGFAISMFATLALAVLAIIGIVQAWMATTA